MTRRSFAPPAPIALPSDVPRLSTSSRGDEPGPVASLAVREVLDFPIRLLRELPLPTTLLCSFAHEGGCVVLATAPPSTVPGDPPAPVFVGPEVDALALAAEHDRARAATLKAWCAKKPDWRLTSIEAIGKLGQHVEPMHWTTAQVLRALGLRLDEVRL